MARDPLIVVVGHCTAATARIFVCANSRREGPTHARLWWQSDSGAADTAALVLASTPPFAQGIFELSELPAGNRIAYKILVEAQPLPADPRPDGATEWPRFRLLPHGRPLRIALVSCNAAFEVRDEKRRYDRWRALARLIDKGEVDLVVHGGDQVYTDLIRVRFDSDPKKRGMSLTNATRMAQLTGAYRRWYVECSWQNPEVAYVHQHVPNLMTWDDHDIYDGYGSHDDDGKPTQQAFFKAAQQAYREFQTSHGPPALDPGTSLTAFAHDGVGIALLDTRSQRMWSQQCVLGATQLEAFKTWCQTHAAKLQRLYVVCSIPIVHAKVAASVEVLRVLPGREGIEDDLRDAWTARNNRFECRRLLMTLFGLLKENSQLQITLLSGDVHVGAIAEIRSNLAVHQRPTGEYGRMYQVTSSGIGHPPPEGAALWLIRRATSGDLDLGNDLSGSLRPLSGGDGVLFIRRNFAVLRLDDEDGGWNKHGNLVVEFHGEDPQLDDFVAVQVLHGYPAGPPANADVSVARTGGA